jgi:hypothetical protein
MAIWGCGLPAHSPSPSGFVYLEFSWARPPLLQPFPFPSTLGEVTLHLLSQARVFIHSSHGKLGFPPFPVEFSSHHHFYNFPAPGCWVCAAAAAFSGWLVRDFPFPHLRCSGCPALYAMCLFCCYCLLFSFFSLGGGQSVQGAMLIWPRVVCGSIMCHLAHLIVCVFPSSLGAGF